MRPPPRSTLSPHTTLSRSLVVERDPPARGRQAAHQRPGQWRDAAEARRQPVGDVGLVAAEELVAALAGEDRKSTRLNSSHANISYAVFCLKKTNNTSNQTD